MTNSAGETIDEHEAWALMPILRFFDGSVSCEGEPIRLGVSRMLGPLATVNGTGTNWPKTAEEYEAMRLRSVLKPRASFPSQIYRPNECPP